MKVAQIITVLALTFPLTAAAITKTDCLLGAGTCCCKMSNGATCCGPASSCPSTSISGCPCAR